jgi:threonine dehydratase
MMQATGAFKLRGAANAILNLSEAHRKQGIITMSSGNHGKAVAFVANLLGIKAKICVPNLVPLTKIDAIKQLGVEVIVHGDSQDETAAYVVETSKQEGLKNISAFDDPDVIAGQGTIAIEILEERPEIDTLLVQVSGGGLMSGIAIAAKSIKPDIKLIGVTMDRGAAMYESIKQGKIVAVKEIPSLADALQGGIPLDNQYTFNICRKYVDEIMLVTESQIARAMSFILRHERIVLEGGGAAPCALLLDKRASQLGKNIAIICSGDNVDMNLLLSIAQENSDV